MRVAGALVLPLCLLAAGGCGEEGLSAGGSAEPIDSLNAAGGGEGVVEVEFSGSAAMILPVHVNGEGPLDFALDTGSTLTCVDREVARRLSLPGEAGRRGVAAGAAGVGEMSVVRIDSLRLGDASMRSLQACVVDLAHARQVGVEIEGLIGLNFLRAYRVEIDFDRRVVRLGR